MKRSKLIFTFFLAIAFAFTTGCTNSLTQETDLGTNPTKGSGTKIGNPKVGGSGTMIGNPQLSFLLDSHIYMSTQTDSDNLYQVLQDSVSNVIDYTNPNSASDSTTAKSFAFGHNGETVVALKNKIEWHESHPPCQIFHIQDTQIKCPSLGDFELIGKPQFDLDEHVYLYGKNSNNSFMIKKWSPSSQNASEISTGQVSQWEAHAKTQSTFFISDDKLKFHNPESGTTLVWDSTPVTAMVFADENKLVFQTEDLSNYLYNVEHGSIGPIDFIGGDLTTAEKHQGALFVTRDQKVYKILPNVAREINIGLDEISLFKIYDEILFAAGTKDGAHKFVSFNMRSPETQPTTLLTGYEIYHLVTDGAALFFDAANTIESKIEVVKMRFNHTAYRVIKEINAPLSQLESIKAEHNGSELNEGGPGAQSYAIFGHGIWNDETKKKDTPTHIVNCLEGYQVDTALISYDFVGETGYLIDQFGYLSIINCAQRDRPWLLKDKKVYFGTHKTTGIWSDGQIIVISLEHFDGRKKIVVIDLEDPTIMQSLDLDQSFTVGFVTFEENMFRVYGVHIGFESDYKYTIRKVIP